MLIGGSGAGKSSFIKSFLYNGNKIKSVGDGQTTRSDVIYSLSRVQDDPDVKVLFMSKNEFVNNMNEHIGTRPIRLIFEQLLGISFDVVDDEERFLILLYELYEQFVQLQEDKNIEIEDDSNKAKVEDCKIIFENIKKILFYSQIDINKTDIYENILENIINIIPYYFIPCVLDINWRVEHVVTDGVSDKEEKTNRLKILMIISIF